MTGMFITLEGGEGAGKSTLMQRLFDALLREGLSVMKTRAPGGSPLGAKIRSLLLHEKKEAISARAELLLFLADRAQHVDEVIKPALQKGQIVLCDRFNDSTIAYQGGARHLGIEEVKKLCQFACAGLEPDLTFYLDLDPKMGFMRLKGEKDRIESETLEFHQEIRKTFHALAKKEKRIQVFDATLPADVVFQKAYQCIQCLQT